MSKILIILISFIIIAQFQITFQLETIKNNRIKTFKNLLTYFNQTKTEIKPENYLKIRNLLDYDDISEDTSYRSTNVPTVLFELFDSFAFFLYTQNLTYLLDNEEVETCFFDGMLENIRKQSLIDIYIDGSGKSLNDFGNEYVCDYNVRRNVSYLTLHFHVAAEYSTFLGEKEEFFGQDYFYIGLCLPRKCMNTTKLLIQEPGILNICQEVGLSNFKLYVNEDVVKESNNLNKFYSVLIYVYICFNLFKIILGILRVILLNKGYKGYVSDREGKTDEDKKTTSKMKKENEDATTDDVKSEMSNKDTMSFLSQKSTDKYLDQSSAYNNDINEVILSEGENLYNPIDDKEKKLPNYLKLLKLFDFFDNLRILSNNSNKYYNSKSIKSLYIIRFFLMLMSVILQIIYTQIFLPTKNFYNFEFYSSILFILVKLCINASIA